MTAVCNSEGNNHNLPEFELIWDFMHVLIICKFDDDKIKKKTKKKQVIDRKT